MEGIFFLLVGALLFTQSWQLIGLYPVSRTTGLINGVIAIGLGLVATGIFTPAMLPSVVEPTSELIGATGSMLKGTDNPVVTALQGYVALWAIYAAAIASHSMWDFDERAVGFTGLFLCIVSLAYLIAIPLAPFNIKHIPNESVWVLSAAPLVLSILSAMVFFHLAVPIREIKKVTGWFLLGGSMIVVFLGLGVLFQMIGTH